MSLDRRELPRVIVVVEGGVVVGVYSDTEINVDVLDHDNADGQSKEDNSRHLAQAVASPPRDRRSRFDVGERTKRKLRMRTEKQKHAPPLNRLGATVRAHGLRICMSADLMTPRLMACCPLGD
jgi:hypothetical protein